MSEEEKKAIELLKAMIKNKPDTIRLERRKGIYALQLALNLIEKQQKELEQQKEENRKLRNCHLRYEEMTGIDLLLKD